jgi:tellurite resistance protein TerC
MLLLDPYKIPTGVSLAVVAALLTVAVTASWIRTRTAPVTTGAALADTAAGPSTRD